MKHLRDASCVVCIIATEAALVLLRPPLKTTPCPSPRNPQLLNGTGVGPFICNALKGCIRGAERPQSPHRPHPTTPTRISPYKQLLNGACIAPLHPPNAAATKLPKSCTPRR